MRFTDDDRRVSASMAFMQKEMLDPDFRHYLRGIGLRNGQHTIPMLDHEPLSYLARVLTTGGPVPLPALVYIPTEGAPYGYRFIWVDEHDPDRDAPMVEASADTSIGMLYAALHPCGEYVPAEWSQPVRFEKGPA